MINLLHDLFVDTDEPFFTMEFIDGLDVREYCAREPCQETMDLAAETIMADERKLKQVIYNLVANAVKFTPEGGSVTLAACHLSSDNGHWKTYDGEPFSAPILHDQSSMTHRECVGISVKDTGIGLEEEDVNRIFNPFEQVDSSSSRKYQGTGLGLSLCKNLVELHGGIIWAESEGEGKGTTLKFILPI